jgi:hypothetical protein
MSDPGDGNLAENQSTNVLPQYYYLLREAQEASQAVEDFDLHDDNPEELIEWNELLKVQNEANVTLTHYVKDNADALIAEFLK